jgi:filamentous hemagglutinin family protein
MDATSKAPLSRARAARPIRRAALPLAMAAAIAASAPPAALAQVSSTQLPTGGSIAGGTGTINAASGASLTIDQTSSRMALNWSTFDIGTAATVRFNQPSSSAAVLNLVQGGNPTQIFGNLNANGQVFLINTNGMIFGSTAQFNVGGLVASTLGTTASNFMSGNDVLDAGANTVALMSNSGTINAAAGAVNLIGGKVVNSGTITASAGNINLVGADKVTLTFESGGFGVVVDKALQLQLDTLAVDNSGSLSAPGGIITLQARAAQGLFDQLINNSGTITAAALSSGSDGSVSLVANGAGQTGIGGSGSIDVGSGAISISTERSVQQSGTYTAGTLGGSIGGNASFTGSNRIASLGTLDVGGTLGLSNAIGLTQSGALTVGGSSSFSLGSQALTLDNTGNDFGQAVNLSSGSTRIVDSGALTMGTLATGNLAATSTGALNLGSGTASGTLAATSNGGAITQSASNALTVTGSSTLNAGSGAITLQRAANDFGGAVSLTGRGIALADANNLTIAALTLGSNSALSLSAAGTLTLPTSAINTGSANLSLHSGNVLATAAALSGTNVNLSGDAGIALAHDVTATGTLALSAVNGAIVQSAGAVTVTGTSSVNAGSGTIALSGAGNDFGQAVSLTGGTTAITDSGALTLGTLATGNLTATGNGALNLGRGTVTGTLSATSNGGAITQSTSNPLTVTGTSTLNAGTGAITLTTIGNDFGQAVSLTGGSTAITDSGALTFSTLATGNLTATSSGALNLGRGTVTGALSATSNGGAITQSTSNPLTITGTSSVSAGSGAITLTTSGNAFGQAVSLSGGTTAITNSGALTLGTLATGNLTATSSGALNLGSGSVTGTLAVTSNGGAITQSTSSPLTVTGTSTVNAGSGAITLDAPANDFGGAVSLTGSEIALADANALAIATLNLGSNSALSLNAAGTLTLPSSAINTGSANLRLSSGSTLTTAAALSGTNVILSGGTGITLAHDVSATGALALTTSNSTIAQSAGTLSVGATTTIDAGSGAVALEQAGNDFAGAVGITAGSVQIADANALTLDASQLSGSLHARSGGDLHLAGTVRASNADLAVGGLFFNDAGATVLDVSGRWRVYLATPSAGHVFGGLDSGNTAVWNTGAFGTVAAPGNRYVFAFQPTLRWTSTDLSKTYGDSIGVGSAFMVSGLMSGVAGAYRGDALIDVVTGAPSLDSLGSAAAASVAGGPYAIQIAQGTLDAASSGYALAFDSLGRLTVNRAGLTVTAPDAGKTYGQTATLSGYTVDGLRNGDDVASVALASAGTAATANVGDYTITASNADGTGLSNYDITYVDGVLSVGKAGLTITAGNAAKTYGQTGALSGYRVDGLVNADAVASVDLASAGTAATANVGDYTITASNADGTGLSNYDITYVDGVLSVGKAGLTITASDETKRYGVAARLERYNVAGLLNDDTVASVALTSEGVPAGAARGNYLIRASDAVGTGLSNYEVSYVDGTLAVIDAVPSSGVAAIGAETLAARQQPVPPRPTGQTPGPAYRISEEGLALPEQCQRISTSGRACTDR